MVENKVRQDVVSMVHTDRVNYVDNVFRSLNDSCDVMTEPLVLRRRTTSSSHES